VERPSTSAKGARIEKIDDVTCFGKNPDTYPIFLF
jgi:hypothetical protein